MSDLATPAGSPRPSRRLIIGLGTEHRGDDGCGLEVVRSLRTALAGRARLEECSADVTELLDLWSGVEDVIVVDAVRSGRPPGTVLRFEVPGPEPPLLSPTSTHGLSLSEAIGLGRALGRFPTRLVVYGIEAGPIAQGAGVSPDGANGIREACARVRAEVERGGPEGAGG